ncbi:hypothetical protein PIB30_014233 [Stylosanthes scabra]|uniref:Uncharacterized protein n=1 Tax=Stylosanthes scabra TaxID=79078 RepID=A0ABU6X7F0_9FABA|nr:hypothetical protein [Stylosanthes scabra]
MPTNKTLAIARAIGFLCRKVRRWKYNGGRTMNRGETWWKENVCDDDEARQGSSGWDDNDDILLRDLAVNRQQEFASKGIKVRKTGGGRAVQRTRMILGSTK